MSNPQSMSNLHQTQLEVGLRISNPHQAYGQLGFHSLYKLSNKIVILKLVKYKLYYKIRN